MPFLQSVSRVCLMCFLLVVPYLLQTSSKVATNCPFSFALSWNNPKRAKYSLVSLGVCGCSLSAFKNAFKIVVTSMCLYLLFVVIRFKRLFPHWQGLAKPQPSKWLKSQICPKLGPLVVVLCFCWGFAMAKHLQKGRFLSVWATFAALVGSCRGHFVFRPQIANNALCA